MELNDGTLIIYSGIQRKNSKETIIVNAERWNDSHDNFDSLDILLPDFELSNENGFTKDEKDFIISKIRKFAKLIFEFAKEDVDYISQKWQEVQNIDETKYYKPKN
jgi:hypothetical protein